MAPAPVHLPLLQPPTEIVQTPDYFLWIRQDQLVLNAIAGSLSPTLIPFIASAKTSREAWTTLANTYAKPSRGRVSQLKEQLRVLAKGPQTITEYMQTVKSIVDDLAMLNAPVDDEDLTLKILGGLDDDYYKTLCDAIHFRETLSPLMSCMKNL